ncbi:extracellular solute-binding protein [Paenibacillus planticolens]|uniref:Extracellular solute-binding protein n=1 Tax=Paenibacillus planticolens TaxID=2654976 RepID=A0ABX1ZRC6_9BACL|nr:extracellular solute-binding protein [Paenibacillus planticolens]NOV01610.1 extracellular solute-binding protein [Paenibacillus planticolens]
MALTVGSMLLLAGCGDSTESSTASPSAGATAAANSNPAQPKIITASIYDRGAVPAEEGTYESNRWTKWINEQSGIQVKWTPIPRSQEVDKFNVLVASGQAPELITSYDRNMLSRFVSQGVAQPLDEYIEKYSTSYKEYIKKHPELKPFVTFDGKTYAIASMRNTQAATMIWIRQDWLDKLGLKMPTTVDELVEVAKAFRDGDPDGNGKKDTTAIAMSNAYSAVLEDLFMARGGEWFIENGQATLSFFTDRYKEALSLRKTLYSEGLVDKEYVTDKNWARQKQLWITGKAGILFDLFNNGPTVDFYKSQPDAKLMPLSPISTKFGKNGYQKEVPNYLLTIFNKNMKNPQAAMEYVDWMLDKGWYNLSYGLEGTHFELKNNVPVTLDADKLKKEVGYASEYRIVHQEVMTPEFLLARASGDENDQKVQKSVGEAIQVAQSTDFRKDFPYTPAVDEFTDISGQFQKKWDEIVTKVTMTPDLTPEWGISQIRSEWEKLNGKSIEAKVQEWYEQHKADFK